MCTDVLNDVYCRILLYACKIRFPKYPSYLFPFYMYISYRQICNRKKLFPVRVIPDELFLHLLKGHATFSNYDNNCVIVPRRYCRQVGLENYAKLRSSRPARLVYVLPLDLARGALFVGDSFAFNHRNVADEMANVSPVKLGSIKVATEVHINLISSPHDISAAVTDGILKNYFRTPKIVYKDDLIAINLKLYGPEFYYANTKLNAVEFIYYKCKKITHGEDGDCDGGYFCVNGETDLRQSANISSFLPRQPKNVRHFDLDLDDCLIDNCPYGLETYLEMMEVAVKPFLNKRPIQLKPIFLVQGDRGIGKNVVISALAKKLGMHLYKITSGDVSSQVYGQTEIKIKNLFFKSILASPCIVVINNFENFAKNNEGEFDQRILTSFKTEMNVIANHPFPIVLMCVSNTKHLPADLSRLFLQTFWFQAPTQTQRARILAWCIDSKNLAGEIDCNDIAGKTHGFLYEDLDALVSYARKSCRESDEIRGLKQSDFENALDIMQSNYTESLGAPRVPKVEWSDVGGLTDVKHEIIRTINLPLKHPELLKMTGLKRSGILLYGPPGTGKTLLAKAVATECSLCFLSVKGPELLNKYVGQSEQNVREVFEKARQASPCIIFFDELDSLAPNRGKSGDSGGVMDRVVSQLLSEMDGLNKAATIFIIGATNRPDLIDPALLRPGRFDKLLYVGPAEDHESKVGVLRALTRKFRLNEDVNLDNIVNICPDNISGADFYAICSNAWLAAVRKLIKQIEMGEINSDDVSHEDVVVSMDDFEESIKNVKPSISPADLRYFKNLQAELSA